ncbi:helix-turn-helix domain-containing protein, partial [Nonomuraea sp. NPDC050691]|uniref:helix-turn-helix domain-containing protein n=1 Tax=Nonomuraea sp. NPDC050691 TaxID=3155661 RepID=UPI0033F7BDF6
MREDHLEALSLLHDPVRRSLYEAVAGSGGDVGRAEAAEAAGVSRTLAGHHLDRLVEAGLLESGFRQQERRGPGSGRPAKVYRRASGERSVSLPPREYGVLASVLAGVVDALGAEEKAEEVARAAGA